MCMVFFSRKVNVNVEYEPRERQMENAVALSRSVHQVRQCLALLDLHKSNQREDTAFKHITAVLQKCHTHNLDLFLCENRSIFAITEPFNELDEGIFAFLLNVVSFQRV